MVECEERTIQTYVVHGRNYHARKMHFLGEVPYYEPNFAETVARMIKNAHAFYGMSYLNQFGTVMHQLYAAT